MTSLLHQLSPGITNMIRLDHSHVLMAFHQYEMDASPRVKKGLADNVCLAIEIHAQLEEEIFYPALRLVADTEVLRKSTPEHDEMRGLIARLRNTLVTDLEFDDAFFTLMRHVMHHVADEETLLLPAAERLLPQQLPELGARMTRRRLELTAPRTPELASSMARSLSLGTAVAAGTALISGASLLARHRGPGESWLRRTPGIR
ncbi:hemerythrin domain-containing protein [Caenimonas sedimenti]|uniref:Hemerythrin domain-containing protein n=1 Tax=Caenimonas sedimenti TaxID=2596921 RepID=A0A562ZVP3_9BURK|nr:hemerythrin domain-containing protein [Caenimonas sedimenti]TWO72456.1 hemerythrin domain-containing protein [Caenimonas sedimenti]